MSGFADSDALETAADANPLVLRKPFRIDELLNAVDAELNTAKTP